MSISHTHCCYCRRKFSDEETLLHKTKDHFIPSSRSGVDAPENKLQCCLECNRWKKDFMPAIWLRIVEKAAKKNPRGTYTRNDYCQIIGSLRHWIKHFKDIIVSDYKTK